MTNDEFVASMRWLSVHHDPDDCPHVRMSEITMLCDLIDGAIPSLDLLQAHLRDGAEIYHAIDGKWMLLYQESPVRVVASGSTLRAMLINLIFLEC